MLYKETLNNWLTEKKIYLKYSTYTNYYNIITNHIMPNLGEYELSTLDNDILQQFILNQLDNGRTDGKGGISIKYTKDIIIVLKLTIDSDVSIQLPYHPPKQIQIFDKEHQITLINHLQSQINHKNFGILLYILMQYVSKNRLLHMVECD